MTSLVTGATGFIGRALVEQLTARGKSVRAQYRDEAKRRLYLGHGEEAIRGDVCDAAFMREAVGSAQVVYHCAAAHSTCSHKEIRRTNLESVRCLFEAIRASGGAPRVILMSSI